MEIGKGWLPIAEDAIAHIEKLGGRVVQVKEKFGSLTIYFSSDEKVRPIIDQILLQADLRAAVTCEFCGKNGTLRNIGGWWKTVCDDFNKETGKCG